MQQQTITPPRAIEIEEEVLAAMVNDYRLVGSVEELINTDCFYRQDHQLIFETIKALKLSPGQSWYAGIVRSIYEQSLGPEILKLVSVLKDQPVSRLDFFHSVNVLAELSIQRQVLDSSLRVQQAIVKRESMEVLSRHVLDMNDVIGKQGRVQQGITFGDSLNELRALIDRKKVKGLAGVNTGVRLLNNFTDGWQSSDLIIIAGRPGMGKTVTGVLHAYHAALSGIPTAIVTLETSKAYITARIVANLTKIPYGMITRGDLTPYQKEIVSKAMQEIEELPIYYYDATNSNDINDISIQLKSWKRKFGIGFVVIDYIQIMHDREVKAPSETAMISSISLKTKRLQSQLQCPVIALAQLNRETEGKGNKMPGIENLKQSGQLEQDASIIILLYREDYYLKKAVEEKGRDYTPTYKLQYIVGKNREGETGILTLRCKPQYNTIYDFVQGEEEGDLMDYSKMF